MLDCKELTWEQMSEIVFAIHQEAKRRNPIGINLYTPYLKQAEEALLEIAEGEAGNPTSDVGPTAAPDLSLEEMMSSLEDSKTKPPFGWGPAPQWAKDAKESDQKPRKQVKAKTETVCKYCNAHIYQPNAQEKPTLWLSVRSKKATCYPHCGDVHVPKT